MKSEIRRDGMVRSKESGAVSLFSVVLAMLLITVITVSFLRLMLADQNQAVNNDLSQSAYDSAQAGVEDAKRVLLRYKQICNGGTTSACAALRTIIPSDVCNEAIARSGVLGSATPNQASYAEVAIQSRVGGAADAIYDQAYTCVTMKTESPDYTDSIKVDASKVIPLKGAGSFDTIEIRWFSRDDVSSGSVSLKSAAQKSLDQNWPQTRPPVLRTQLMQYGSNFVMSDFDATMGGKSNANSIFLYPVSGGSANSFTLTDRDVRASSPTGEPPKDDAGNSPLPVTCQPTVASSTSYSCMARLALPEPHNGTASNRTAYLRLSSLYNKTHFSVTLFNGATPVNFKEVQAVVDSTGRANDLFRRVESRVNLIDTDLPYPEGAVDVAGDFCKNFSVTDNQYFAGSCAP